MAGKLLTDEPARTRAEDEARCDCGALEQALGMLPGAARIVSAIHMWHVPDGSARPCARRGQGAVRLRRIWMAPCVSAKHLTDQLAPARAEDEARCDCGALEQALGMLPGAARMVVGHTIQDGGINAACGGRVFRIDVGLSKGCGNGEPEVRRKRCPGGRFCDF